MDSRGAFDFLKIKKKNVNILMEEPSNNVIRQDINNLDPANLIFQKDHLEYGDILRFPESQSIEFKQFSTKRIQEYVKSIIPEYISAFANTGGGYLFIGVDDKSKKVLGCPKDIVDPDSLQKVIKEAISKLPIFHFCSSKPRVTYRTKVIDVFLMGKLHSYLCVIKVDPFCCVVFQKAPISWMVEKKKGVYNLTLEKWIGMMMDDDPGKWQKAPPPCPFYLLGTCLLNKLPWALDCLTPTKSVLTLQVFEFLYVRVFFWVIRNLNQMSDKWHFSTLEAEKKNVWEWLTLQWYSRTAAYWLHIQLLNFRVFSEQHLRHYESLIVYTCNLKSILNKCDKYKLIAP
jgi:hypothetical protein